MAEILPGVFDKCLVCGVRPKVKGSKGCQRCLDRHERKYRFRRYILPPEYITASLSDFEAPLDKWNMQDNLFFYGDVGTGRTRAMYALLMKCRKAGYTSRIVEFLQVCADIRETFNGSDKTENKIVKDLADLDVLFVDDLGLSSNVSEFAYSIFYRIINQRIMNCLATVISSNKTIEQIGSMFDLRVGSRLQLFEVIVFDGPDRRKNNQAAR